MFIDELQESGFELNGEKISDTTVFRIAESLSNFWDTNKKIGLRFTDQQPLEDEEAKLLCASFMPYNNLCLSFNDAVLWVVENTVADSTSKRLIFHHMFWKSFMAHEDDLIIKKPAIALIEKAVENFILSLGNIYEPRKFRSDFRRPKSEYEWGCAVQHAVIINTFLNLLSCKNIRIRKNSADVKIQKKRKKKNKLPLISYYTLELQNFNTRASQTAGGFWSNRLHFCRGHVREYGPPGLFGKYTGRFWIVPHIRGKKSKGEIYKDYDLSKIISADMANKRETEAIWD